MKRFDNNLIDNGLIGSSENYGESNKRYNVGLGYRFNRPFGSVAPLNDYEYVIQRNKGGERIGLYSEDLHKSGKGKGTVLTPPDKEWRLKYANEGDIKVKPSSTGHLKDF